jgi:regulator of sigma E protease
MNWITIVFWLFSTLVFMLGPIILIHELGHFIFARLAGVRVEEFGFGFPPRLLKLWRGEGYLEIGSIRVCIPRGFKLPAGLEPQSWVNAVIRQRDDDACVLRHIRVLDPDVDDLAPRRRRVDEDVHVRGVLTILEPGTLYSLNWFPMGAFVKMTGEEDPSDPRSLAAQPKRWRVAVLAAGSVLNLIFALMLIAGAYATGVPDRLQVEVTRVEPGTAAQEAGLRPGDVIISAGGERIEDGSDQLREIIRAAPEQAVELVVLRDSTGIISSRKETLTLTATPRRQPGGYGFLGIMMYPWPDRNALKQYRWPDALRAGIEDIIMTARMTLELPARLAQGSITPQEARPASMVGISEIMAFSLQQSIKWKVAFPALQTASLVSLALGLTNLLPIPAFDGGRILFVFIEAVRGRRISPRREAVIHFVSLMILMSLMALLMLQDLVNPIIPWSLLK